MERLMIDLALIIVSLGIGYWAGFRACFDYLSEELKNKREQEERGI